MRGETDVRFDLIVATVARTEDLEALLGSLAGQTHSDFRVVVVDQNSDDRVERLLALHPGLDALHLRSARGLSRARNRALVALRTELEAFRADVVGFPDDDCLYAPDLLERVAHRFATDSTLDGLSGRPRAADGRVVGRWPSSRVAVIPENVWRTANSHTIFLRRPLVERVGAFDEALGLGSGTPWSSGEEIDYVVRALGLGARIEYDPTLEIIHPIKPVGPAELVALGARDGGSVGYVLARNDYPGRTVAKMLVRPFGAALISLLALDPVRARFYAATLVGRFRGLAAGRRIARR